MPHPPTPLNREIVDRLNSFLRARRAGNDRVVQLDEVDDGRGGTVPVVAGELLIRTEHLDRTLGGLRQRVPQYRAVPALGGALTRILLPESQRPQLRDLFARMRRDDDLPVRPNALVPTGTSPLIVWKANSTPEAAQAPAGEPVAVGGTPVRVAVLDTGIADQVRSDHWLDGLLRPDNVDPLDVFPTTDGYLDVAAGHGTFVAGIVRQLVPDADLQVFRVVDSDGLASEVDVAEALVRVVKSGATVVNLSLGVETFDDEPPEALAVALEQLATYRDDVVIVASAGNSGVDRPTYPAACAGVIGVAATTPTLANADWSSRGDWVTCSTVGEQVRSTFVQGKEDPAIDPEPESFGPDAWALWTGTSFAAPQVAGQVAAIAQRDGVSTPKALETLLAGAVRTEPKYGKVLESVLPA